MYPSPDESVYEKLKTTELLEVGIRQYDFVLRFENGNKLQIAAPFRFAPKDDVVGAPVMEFPLREANMIRLLGHSIGAIEVDDDGSLTLDFDNGDTLIVYANDPAYEAYDLYIDGIRYTV